MEVLPNDNPDAVLRCRDYLGIVIAAGGRGLRFGAANKLFQHYLGIPLFIHSLLNFRSLCRQENFVLVAPPGQLVEFEHITRQFLPDFGVQCISGGTTRMASVKNGLEALGGNVRYVAIHDAARPLATAELLLQCLAMAEAINGGAVPAKPVTDTLRRTNEQGFLSETVPRENLWHMETPQVFNLTALRDAFARALASRQDFTDDAAIMRFAGYPVVIASHHRNNLKVTYPEDVAKLPTPHENTLLTRLDA